MQVSVEAFAPKIRGEMTGTLYVAASPATASIDTVGWRSNLNFRIWPSLPTRRKQPGLLWARLAYQVSQVGLEPGPPSCACPSRAEELAEPVAAAEELAEPVAFLSLRRASRSLCLSFKCRNWTCTQQFGFGMNLPRQGPGLFGSPLLFGRRKTRAGG